MRCVSPDLTLPLLPTMTGDEVASIVTPPATFQLLER